MALTDRHLLGQIDLGSKSIYESLPVTAVRWAGWSRFVVDLNRGPDDLDERGVLPLIDFHGRPVYHPGRAPGRAETLRRLDLYYRPYHHWLSEALRGRDFEVFFDCHSMEGVGPPAQPDAGLVRDQIVLGNLGDESGRRRPDREYVTCPPEKLAMMGRAFEEAGFSVSMNRPFSGGYITAHYGRELIGRGKTAVQIEINRDMYVVPDGLEVIEDKLAEVTHRVGAAMKEIARNLS